MEEQKATDAGPEAPAKRRGRPPGSKRKATDRELIERLAARIDALQKSQSDMIDTSKISLSGPAREAIPGTILAAGKDNRGDPILFKKAWTMGDMARTYPEVTFTPAYTTPVTVQRVTVQMVAGREWKGPKVFKDVYEERMMLQHPDMGARYPGPNPTQTYEQNEAARRAGGDRVFGGLGFIGVGMVTPTPDGE